MRSTIIKNDPLRLAFVLLISFLPFSVSGQWKPAYGHQARSQQPTNGNDPLVTFGLYHTGDFYKNSAGFGLGMMCNIGRTTHLINGCFGVEYVEYFCGDPRPDDEKSKLPFIGGAGQVVVPAFLKIQLFPTSKWTKFYIGCGCEAGFKVYDSDALKDYYANGEVQEKNSFAVVPIIGWKGRNLDFGVYYKHYTKQPFFHSLDGRKDLGEDKARIGYHVTYYF